MKAETRQRKQETTAEILVCHDMMSYLATAEIKEDVDSLSKSRITIAQKFLRHRMSGRPSKYFKVSAAYLLRDARRLLRFDLRFFSTEKRLQDAFVKLAHTVETRAASITELEQNIAQAKTAISRWRKELNEQQKQQEPDLVRLERMRILAEPPNVADERMVAVRGSDEATSDKSTGD